MKKGFKKDECQNAAKYWTKKPIKKAPNKLTKIVANPLVGNNTPTAALATDPIKPPKPARRRNFTFFCYLAGREIDLRI